MAQFVEGITSPEEGRLIIRYRALAKRRNIIADKIQKISHDDPLAEKKIKMKNCVLESIDRELRELTTAIERIKNHP